MNKEFVLSIESNKQKVQTLINPQIKQNHFTYFQYDSLIKKYMSNIQPIKNILESLRTQKCQRKGCLSENRDHLELVWFGKHYDNKDITCSSCYMLDDEAIKKSIPTTYNVLPILKFNDKLFEEYKLYEQRKKSLTWHPLLIKNKKTQIINELNNFELQLTASLTSLETALQNFIKALEGKHKQIQTHQIMNQIIEMKGKNQFERLLESINQLVKHLNYSQITKNYEFERIDLRNKKLQKEKTKVNQVVSRVDKVLAGLFQDIKKRNEIINKI